MAGAVRQQKYSRGRQGWEIRFVNVNGPTARKKVGARSGRRHSWCRAAHLQPLAVTRAGKFWQNEAKLINVSK